MKMQEGILKALTGELPRYRAADILGLSPRTLRRCREPYEQFGYDGLQELQRRTPSRKRVRLADVTRIVHLYRAQCGFNARHCHRTPAGPQGMHSARSAAPGRGSPRYGLVACALRGAHPWQGVLISGRRIACCLAPLVIAQPAVPEPCTSQANRDVWTTPHESPDQP